MRDGVVGGHLFGVRSPGRVGDLGVAGKPSSLSILTRNKASAKKEMAAADNSLE